MFYLREAFDIKTRSGSKGKEYSNEKSREDQN